MLVQTKPLTAFEYFAPASLDEALKLLSDGGAQARVLAGGTDMMLDLKSRAVQPGVIVDLNRVRELSFVETSGDTLKIGATTTLNEIKESLLVRERTPVLLDTLMEFASDTIRNRATMGGNLCNASPAADLGPPLLVLDALVVLRGMAGERSLPLSEFFVGPGRTALQPGEVMTRIDIPLRDGRSSYLKLGRRKGFAISIVSVAAFGVITDGTVEDIKVALCAVAPTPIRGMKAEAALNGQKLSEGVIEEAARLVGREVEALTDIREPPPDDATPSYRRATSPYRVEMSQVMARRVLTSILNGGGARE
jgi:carbon-monoxide dehydrogenase medium subunit